MKNIAVISILSLVLLAPKITHAAWWNPFAWFKQPPKIDVPLMEVKIEDVVRSDASTTSRAQTQKPSAPTKKQDSIPVVQKVEDRSFELNQQKEIAEAKRRAEEQLKADSLKDEIGKQVRAELERIRQAEADAAEEKRQALLRAEEERNRVTISVGESVCRGNKLVLPYRITGPMPGAVIRIFSENGAVDMRSGISPDDKSGNIPYGHVSDLSADTTTYANPTHSPFLNGSEFHYSVEVYDQKHTSARKKVVAEQSGDIVLPSCN